MPMPRAPVGARLFEGRDGRFAIFTRSAEGARENKTTLPLGITRCQAEEMLKEVQRSIRSGAWLAPQTWEEAIEQFLESRAARGCRKGSLATYKYALLAVHRALPGVEPFALTAEHAKQFMAARSELSAATVRNQMAQVVVFQAWAVEQKWQKEPTWEGVRRPAALRPEEGHKRVLSTEEVGRLCRAAESLADSPPEGAPAAAWQWWPAALGLLLHGLRLGELLSLRASDVRFWRMDGDGEERLEASVAIGQSKTRSGRRTVPVVDGWVVDHLQRAAEGLEPRAILFRSTRGDREGRFVSPQMINHKLRRTCLEAQVDPEGVCAHALRHTFATATISSVDVVAVQRALGHSAIGVTVNTYAHRNMSQAMPAAQAFGRWLAQGRTGKPALKAVEGGKGPETNRRRIDDAR